MDLLATPPRRRLLFAVLYFAEGAPIGFLWWALPTILRDQGVAVDRIAALVSLLVLPWSLKFLWAPLLDVLRGPRWTLRGWIVSSQICMAVTLVPLAWIDPVDSFAWLAGLLSVHAVAAATQDVAIDALAIASTAETERGTVNGWMQAGMLIGRALFGGGALMLRSAVADGAEVLVLAGAVAMTAAIALLYHAPQITTREPLTVGFVASLRRALSAPSTWFGLLFASVGGAAFEALGALAGPFLVDAGMRAAAVGRFFAAPAVGLMLVGGLIGGRVSDLAGRRRSVALFTALVAASVGCVAGLAEQGAEVPSLLVSMAAVYLAIGLFTASSYALFMDLTDVRLGSTQFSAFMSATNLCEAWAALVAGKLVVTAGYPSAFGAMAVVTLAAIPLLLGAGHPSARHVVS